MVEINFMIFMNAQHSHTWNIKTEIIVGIGLHYCNIWGDTAQIPFFVLSNN